MKRATQIMLAVAIGTALPAAAWAQHTPLPRLERVGDKHLLQVDGQPFLMLGAQANNSSTSG